MDSGWQPSAWASAVSVSCQGPLASIVTEQPPMRVWACGRPPGQGGQRVGQGPAGFDRGRAGRNARLVARQSAEQEQRMESADIGTLSLGRGEDIAGRGGGAMHD